MAFVGTSHVHTPDYLAVTRSMPWLKVVGIAEPDPDTIGLIYDLPPLFDRQEDLPDHDVAVVLTDADSHDRVCAGLTAPAVFIEKPLAVSHNRAQHISRLLTQRGIDTETGFFLRHSAAFNALCGACNNAQMGTARFARFSFSHPGFLDGWLQKWPAHISRTRMGGGAFADLAIHLVDAATCIFGPLTAGSCQLDTSASTRLGFDTSFDTQGQATLTSHEGCLIHVWASAEAPSVNLRIEVFWEGGEVLLNDGCVTRKYRAANPEVVHDGEMPTPADGFRAALEGFRNRSERITNVEEAVSANALMEALLKTASKLS
ncbi:Gfo/Idh/MocA family protein [Marivita hallyeonensis]|uniref:Gfo/Idh/MocA family protein n=1 Tax=Marivita hallyeonensis TaxID=996342 RepID=UPI0015B6E095|nr:Gfo/Idh/MocA family oxidoreductase [Marivita hallyeonensis]